MKSVFIKDKNREPTIVERFISGSSAGALGAKCNISVGSNL